MTAMAKTPGFKANRELELRALFNELVKALRDWIGEETLSHHERSLWNDIFIRAARLQRLMRCSKRDYFMKEAEATRNQLPKKSFSWTLRNIQTWRTVNYNCIDDLYRVFHPISPGLYRRGVGDEEDLELVKPVVVIYKTEQQQSIPASPSLTRGLMWDADDMHHVKDQSPKRATPSHINSQSDRPSDSGSFLSHFKSKKKHSEPKQKPPESHHQESRSKSAASHRTKSRRPSQSHEGEHSSTQASHDRRSMYMTTTSVSPQDYESSALGLKRSYTSPEG
jgi:hypothetical protein